VKTGRTAPILSFAGAARRYWLGVFPRVRRERDTRKARASEIRDPALREVALAALGKWGNVEGAAAFATFAPRLRRTAAIRAMSAFQAAYNYLDMLAERPSGQTDGWPGANAERLHEALLVALDPAAPPLYYYAGSGQTDGGYLQEMVEECRAALGELPCWPAVLPAARRAAERIIAFQSASTGDPDSDRAALRATADEHGLPGWELRWWETAAACGSSLCVFALIAAAAQSRVDSAEIAAIEHAYFPWIGALHSLLDNLVDVAEDHATGQHSLIGCYPSAIQASAGMRLLAQQSLRATQDLANPAGHVLILAAMASFYLSSPEADTPDGQIVAAAVLDTLGTPARRAMLVFLARRRIGAQPC
jgi:tetraprenyl-beta-curcumene synthase